MPEESPPAGHFSDHQSLIYARGMYQGLVPDITTDLSALESRAAEVLDPAALGYIVPSAGGGATARANAEAFTRWRIVPRMFRDHATRDLSTTVLGTAMPAPVMFGPVGVQRLAHPDGDLATAAAARELGLPFVHSTQASYSIEEVAEVGGDGPRWYQLYWPSDDELCVSLLRRARTAGYTHLVITLDTTLLGWRPRDLDRGHLPFLAGDGIANYTSDPVFRRRLEKSPQDDPAAAGFAFASVFPNPGLTWDRLGLIRKNWDGPILLKGIQAVEDAELAVEHGIDGIVVSNHGGRQVDGAIASLDALAAIAPAVGDAITVLFDSGIRTGSDIVKALALGAEAVLIGRPYLYGLALGGREGVEHVMRSLLAELDLTLGNAGYDSHRDLTPEALVETR